MPDEMSYDPLRTAGGNAIPFIGAFESTFMPGHDRDVAELTGHTTAWREDLETLAETGVRRVRYPLRWHRIEPRPGELCFSRTDAVLHHMRELGLEPIVDLVHHTSYPMWLEEGFRDRRFGAAYIRYAEAVAQRYPWLNAYTLFNEPFATLFLSGHEALWPPYDRGMDGFVRLVRNVLPAVSEASVVWSELLPDAKHVWVDTCEHHTGSPGGPAAYAALANDRRYVVLDLALGHDLDPRRPFLQQFLHAGGDALAGLAPVRVDMLGLDYYCHSEWWYDENGSHSPSPRPLGFAALAEQYSTRYGLPMLLSETNLRGLPSDRASWLRYTLEQYELALSRGVPLQGYCWFPYVDSCDWDSLLARPAGRIDPVGVVAAGNGTARKRTSFTGLWEAAAAGKPAAELPAYRFQSPCNTQLAGLLPQMRHWDWTDPPSHDVIPPVPINSGEGATDAIHP
jgi:beta-glucosidase/6-phospho-beta-glucosidase/beta-galactosidase